MTDHSLWYRILQKSVKVSKNKTKPLYIFQSSMSDAASSLIVVHLETEHGYRDVVTDCGPPHFRSYWIYPAYLRLTLAFIWSTFQAICRCCATHAQIRDSYNSDKVTVVVDERRRRFTCTNMHARLINMWIISKKVGFVLLHMVKRDWTCRAFNTEVIF